MRIDVITLHPDFFDSPLQSSLIGRAIGSGKLAVNLYHLREFTKDKHRTTDSAPYGGGPGMLLKPEPISEAFEKIAQNGKSLRIYLSAQGEPLTDNLVRELAGNKRLTLLCGHYEGVDERVLETCIDKEICIGDYVLTGGEPAAMVLIDAVARQIPGVLGNSASPESESFADDLLEGPQYTKPSVWNGKSVPDVLLSGNHAKIAAWRKEQSIKRTAQRRPDLLAESKDPHRLSGKGNDQK